MGFFLIFNNNVYFTLKIILHLFSEIASGGPPEDIYSGFLQEGFSETSVLFLPKFFQNILVLFFV